MLSVLESLLNDLPVTRLELSRMPRQPVRQSVQHSRDVRSTHLELPRTSLVNGDQRHALLVNVVHVTKSKYSGFALGGGDEEVDAAHAGRSNGLAVNDLESLVLTGVEGGEHSFIVADVVRGA